MTSVLLIDLFKLQLDLLEKNFIKVFPIILECFSGIGQCIIARIQRHIQNPVKRLRWIFLRKYVTTFNAFEKSAIEDVWQGSEYTSGICPLFILFRNSLWHWYGLRWLAWLIFPNCDILSFFMVKHYLS